MLRGTSEGAHHRIRLIDKPQVVEVEQHLDYHAIEYIADALRACRNLGKKARTALLEELCRLLLQPGGVAPVITRLGTLARGRRAKRVNKELRYLQAHLDHMDDASMRARKPPIGSGIVESAVRRVINLRFKVASTGWTPEHLETLLYLRAVAKSGHWDDLMQGWLGGTHWLRPRCPHVEVDRRRAA